MVTDANSLLSEVACYNCVGLGGVGKLIELGLLRQILLALNPMADTSTNALLETVGCYNCLLPGQQTLIGLALLKQIVDGGLGAGGGVTYGTVNPTTAPVNDSGLYYNTTSGEVWIWNPITASWDLRLA